MPCRLYLVNCLAIYSYLIPRLPRFYPLQFATLLRVAWLTAGFAWSDVAIPPLASCGQRKGCRRWGCRRWGCRLRSPEIGSRPRATAGAHLDSSHQRDLAELPAQWRGLPRSMAGSPVKSSGPELEIGGSARSGGATRSGGSSCSEAGLSALCEVDSPGSSWLESGSLQILRRPSTGRAGLHRPFGERDGPQTCKVFPMNP